MSVADDVAAMAARHGITYTATAADEWAEIVTPLCGDDLSTDDTRDLLVALRRAGIISGAEMVALLGRQLCENQQKSI